MEAKITIVEKQLVVFNLGKEAYAVDISMVREIIQMQAITQIPGMFHSVEGVINLRGAVIPIVDLRKRFKLARIENDKNTRIVVVNCKEMDVGVIVDSVAEVLRIPIDSIESAANLFTTEHIEHLLGIVKLQNKLIILLDMKQVLSSQEAAVISSMDLTKTEKTSKEPALV